MSEDHQTHEEQLEAAQARIAELEAALEAKPDLITPDEQVERWGRDMLAGLTGEEKAP